MTPPDDPRLPPREDLIARLRQVAAPTVYDVLLKLGHGDRAAHSDIAPLVGGRRIAGPARTIRGRTIPDDPDEAGKWGTAFSYDFFRSLTPGDVIVFDCGGHAVGGPWGGNTASTAKAKGVQGIVIDGGTRDRTDLTEIGFPTHCRFVTPVLAHGRFQITGFDEPAELSSQTGGTMTVSPGDWVVADDDGIVVIPGDLLGDVLTFAEYAEAVEKRIRSAIESGEDRESVDARLDRWKLLKDTLAERGGAGG